MISSASSFAQYRVIRAFVSSTFRDMSAERDELLGFTFLQLRKLCEERGAVWGEVDLRWGITDEQKLEGKVLPICLEEIRRCRPYFIGILGERYGWIPDEVPGELLHQEPWLAEHRQRSVTELEILHGVLNDPEMADHAFFYFRSPAFIDSLPAEEQRLHREEPRKEEIERLGPAEAQRRCEERKQKLATLKERIRASGFPVREDYENPRHLGRLVLEDLSGVIDRLFPQESLPDPLDREAAEHQAFAASRCGVYIGRHGYFDRLDEHARGDAAPLVVLGESGSGKSALLANWAERYRQEHPEERPLLHFIGASSRSADWRAMLRRMIGEFNRRFGVDLAIPDSPDELRQTFARALHMTAARSRVVVVLDALNQLEDQDQAPDLVWLPPEIPAGVRLIVSTLPGRSLDDLVRRQWPTLQVEPLTLDERRRFTESYLAQYTKALSAEHSDLIASATQTASPLYLRVLLEELRLHGDHFALVQKITEYLDAETVVAIYESVLKRYERDYERDSPGLVGRAMSLLWAARRGLTETELLELLGVDGARLPRAYWSPLFLAAEHALVNLSGLIGFGHDYLRQAVETLYLPDPAARRDANLRLADYFAERDLGPRKVDELPWQLEQAAEWQRLSDLLIELPFFEASWAADPFEVKRYWARIETESQLRLADAFEPVIDNPSKHTRYLWPLAVLFYETGHPSPALELREHLVEHFRATGQRSKLAAALGAKAWILQVRGDLEKAMALHIEEEQVYREVGDRDGLRHALGHQAVILKLVGDLDAAMALHEQEERICRELGNRSGLQISLGNQGMILEQRGDLDAAMARHKEAEMICRELGDKDGLAACFGTQAPILAMRGDLDGALALRRKQERICRELGNKTGLQWALGEQAVLLQHRRDFDGAMALLQEQERICRDLGNKGGLTAALGNQAVILQIRGDLDRAMARHKQAEQLCRELDNKGGLATSLGGQAWILQARGDDEEALALHQEEERLYRELRHPQGLVVSLGNQAVLLAEGLHQPQRALLLVEEASNLVSRYGLTAMARQIGRIRDKVRSMSR